MLKFKMYQQIGDVLLLCIIFPILIFACKSKSAEQVSAGASSSITPDKIKLLSLNGQPIDFSQYKDKTIFINFWATWCKPCVKEMPSIQNAIKVLEKENIVFLFASDEPADLIEKFNQRYNFPFQYVRVENYQDYGIMGLPTTFIFSPDGDLKFSEMGFRKWDDKTNIDLIQNIIKTE